MFSGNQILFNVVDGVIRIGSVPAVYPGVQCCGPILSASISYHGAEHKTVFAFESRGPLTVGKCAELCNTRFSALCRSGFLTMSMLISMLVYMQIPATTFWARFGFIALLPVIAGLSYEMILSPPSMLRRCLPC